MATVGVSAALLGICCGGGYWLMSFSTNIIAAEIETQIRDNPRLREHLGEIQEFEMDWSRSIAAEDDDTFVYKVKGTKGSGELTVKHITNDDGDEEIVSASLRLESGQTVDLLPVDAGNPEKTTTNAEEMPKS